VYLVLLIALAGRGATPAAEFANDVEPLLSEYCVSCHGADEAEAGIRLDQLDEKLPNNQLRLWEGIRSNLANRSMPPEGELQPDDEQRAAMVSWIDQALAEARSRPDRYNGSVRRLTVNQYRNTLKELLGIQEEIANSLPPDAVSEDGFTNNSQSMSLLPLQVEAYLSIAGRALDLCIVDENSTPALQCVQVDLGKGINVDPFPEELILGANNALLDNSDFVVSQPDLAKSFDFDQVRMRTKFRFNEGYSGNATVRGWREYNSIYHAVFACVRGPVGYPKGRAWETVPDGLLVRPSIPGRGLFGVDSTYGHRANFKVSLRELPQHGNFRITVAAAKCNDALLLESGVAAQSGSAAHAIVIQNPMSPQPLTLDTDGIYQVDVDVAGQPSGSQWLNLSVGKRQFSGQVSGPAFLVVRLPEGVLNWGAQLSEGSLDRLVLTRLEAGSPLVKRFEQFEKRTPHLGVHIGLRRDCGTTFSRVGEPQMVATEELTDFVFEDAICNFPGSVDQEANDNYLAGVRDVGIRSESTDGRDMPRLLIRSVRFEGPYYESWPPVAHRRIFFDSQHPRDSEVYALEVIYTFAERAFRRMLKDDE